MKLLLFKILIRSFLITLFRFISLCIRLVNFLDEKKRLIILKNNNKITKIVFSKL